MYKMIKSYLKSRTQFTKINRIDITTRTAIEYKPDYTDIQYGGTPR